ncbi:hypothetical protein LINPERPRIM_LOCUS38239 [Linum perenne]
MGRQRTHKKLAELPAASNPLESSTNPNSSEQVAAANLREDGELSSSSDDDENYSSTQLESSGADNPSAAQQPCLVESTKKSMQQSTAVNGVCAASPVSTVDVSTHASAEANNGKNALKSRLPSKSSNSGRQAALSSDNNLVIRFSDEDSGSESENHSQRKNLRSKIRKTGPDGSRQLLPLSSTPKTLQHAGANVCNIIPRKPTPTHTFVSSVSNINRGITSGAGPAQTGQSSWGRSFNDSNRSTHVNTFELGLGLNHAKLQDLRQQIAMREKELKLKADQQNKLSALVSVRENSTRNLSRNAPRRSNICTDAVSKEPDRKRAKVNGSFSNQLKSDRQQVKLPPNSIQPSNVETAGVVQQDMGNCSNNISPKRVTDLDVVESPERHNEMHFISSANPASELKDGKCFSKGISCLQGSVDNNHLVKIPQHPGSSNIVMSEKTMFLNQGASSRNIISPIVKNSCQSNSIELALPFVINLLFVPFDSIIFQASLNNTNFSSCLRNVSDNSDKKLCLLVEMEDKLDKELEEAQEQRYRCEIEERNALKVYRRAQRALIEATGRCTELYRKRELHSSQFGSLIMNDPSLLLSPAEHDRCGLGLSPAEQTCQNTHPAPSSIHQKQLSDGQNLRSQPCSEPELSTSEPLHHGFMNNATRRSSPTEDPNVSSDEEVFPIEHDADQCSNMQPITHNSCEQPKDLDHPSDKQFSLNDSQDPLILEASLRSELYARYRMRALPKTTVSSHLESADEVGTENDIGSERTQMSNSSLPVLAAEKRQECNLEGEDNPERVISERPSQDKNLEKAFHSTADSGHIEYASRGYQLTPDMLSTPIVWRSVFEHLKVMSTAFLAVKGIDNQQRFTIFKYVEDDNDVESMEVQYSNVTACSMEESTKDICEMEIGSFSSNAAVDPFWPLCMYELRGKCNNSDCPWQHVADFSGGTRNKNQQDSSHDSDLSPRLKNERTTAKHSNYGGILDCPTYLVGLDIIKARTHTYGSIVAWKDGKCWQKSFSACLALSSLLVKDLPANELFLCGNEGRIEMHGSWNTQLSCFRSRNGLANYQNQVIPSTMQALEMSLATLSQEVNKVENMKKSLSMLSRAIESDPTSEVLWIMYLLVYYSNIKSIEKNDMFSYAMLECLCMSGNIDLAVQKVYGLFSLINYSDETHSPLFSDILKCLTISDKYMFWVCCVYLVIYRKLPVPVLQQFECEKDLFAIDWPPVDLKGDEKHRAVELVEMMIDSVELFSKNESLESKANNKVAQWFALNHIRCVIALGRLEFCCTLLEKYLNLYPQCLELVLIAARSQSTDAGGSRFDAFENALINWPKEVPGILGLWNQYVEFALERRGPLLAKDLLVCWFNSISECRSRDSTPVESLELASALNPEFLMPYSNQVDIMFGFLNLSVAKMLQNDRTEARAAIDKAFKSAPPLYFDYCLVEHATFLLEHEQWLTKDAPVRELLRILKGYLDDSQALFVSEPLSRRFIKNVDKPRVEQLISNVLSPVSSDYSRVNLVLKAWYGPPLVPHSIGNSKELVELVEAILEMVPSNYPLVVSVSILVDSIFHTVPVAPECVWAEVAQILSDTNGAADILSERFYKRALSVYPFSKKLWCWYKELVKDRKGGGHDSTNDVAVEEAARKRGIEV